MYNVALFLETNEDADVSEQTEQIAFGRIAGGTAAAEAMASQLHNNYRLQQMASEGYELSAKSVGGRRTPLMNTGSSMPLLNSTKNLNERSDEHAHQSPMKH